MTTTIPTSTRRYVDETVLELLSKPEGAVVQHVFPEESGLATQYFRRTAEGIAEWTADGEATSEEMDYETAIEIANDLRVEREFFAALFGTPAE